MLEIAIVAVLCLLVVAYLVYRAVTVFVLLIAVPTAVVFTFGGFAWGFVAALTYATITRWGSSIHDVPAASRILSGWQATIRAGSWLARRFHALFNIRIVDSDHRPIVNVYATLRRTYGISHTSSTRYVFVMYPHGVIPLGAIGFAGLSRTTAMWNIVDDVSRVDSTDPTPQCAPPTLLVHRWLFMIPGIRDIVLWVLGCRDVGRVSMTRHLDAGASIAFLPDGARGMLPRDSTLNTRRGWFDLLWHHKDRNHIVVVPCVSVGDTQAKQTLTLFRQWCYRLFKYPFPTFMTRRSANAPVLFTVGRPVALVAYDDPEQHGIDVAWNTFCDRLVAIGGPKLARSTALDAAAAAATSTSLRA